MVDSTVILAGAVPAALLALAVDAGLLWVERQLSTRRRSASRRTVLAAGTATLAVMIVSGATVAGRSNGAIVVGSKNFTEQVILGEVVAQTIERDTGLPVQRRLNLGGTLICDRALTTGDIDVYVEYTGTALTAVFHRPVTTSADAAYEDVRQQYARTGRTLLPALGFDNTFAILVRGQDARSLGLKTIDDAARVAPGWRAGFGYEFLERPDGYPGLANVYGLRFKGEPHVMDLSLSYRALSSRQVDLIAGDATAGLISALDLVQLEDSRHYFPPYAAAPVARAQTLLRYPQVRRSLEHLGGKITAADMRRLNYAVDVEHKDVSRIVTEFLTRKS
jgi:osmoprotectant transport system permease protein